MNTGTKILKVKDFFNNTLAPLIRCLFIGIWGPSLFSYRECQFRHLLSEYYARGGQEDESSTTKLGQIIKSYKEGEYIEWDDICLLEIHIIKQLDKSGLILKEQQMRSRYKSIADEDRYRAYEQVATEIIKNSKDTDDSELRGSVTYLAHQLYWTYAVTTKGHKIRTRAGLVVTYVFVASLVYLLTTFNTVTSTDNSTSYSPYYLAISVVCFGAFGAYISFQRRMAKLRIQSETYMAFLQLRSSYFDGISALFSGALFALLFIVLWQSAALQLVFNQDVLKNLLPVVKPLSEGGEEECIHSIGGLFSCLKIVGVQDFSKLLVISFLAGFAEQLVPDAIDHLVGKTQSKA